MTTMNKDASIFIAGHRGLVGSAMVQRLQREGFKRLITRDRSQLDLRSQPAVDAFFAAQRPECVVLAAAKVGGIHANNSYPAEFIYDNLAIQGNIIDAAYRHGVRKLLFLGSSCIYPKLAPQPIREDYLLSGPLEATNQWYAIAKIAGLKMCQAYRRQYGFNAITAMPTNLYGPRDNFDLQNAHVLPALIRKFHEAKRNGDSQVVIWGTGTPRREFLFVDDAVDACLFLMNNYADEELINVGCGEDISIRELAQLIQEIVEFHGALVFDESKPDGTPRKLLDISRLRALGWRPQTALREGIAATYAWYVENHAALSSRAAVGHSR
jgi:GDP-L-fucose synthase